MYNRLASAVNWFKFNTIRYFEIHVDAIKAENSRTNRLYQSGLDSGFSPSDSTWYQKSPVVVDRRRNMANYGIGMGQGQLGHCRQSGGISEANIYKTDSRYPFFISEVRTHYRNLNRDIYRPLSNLTVISRNGTIFDRYRVSTNILDDFLSQTARNHIMLDNGSLIHEVEEYLESLAWQNRVVNAAERTIHSIIKNSFIERGVYPAVHYQDRGYFGHDIFRIIFVFVCEDFLASNKNVENFIKNYTILPHLEYNTVQDFQKLGNHVLGRGSPIERNNMKIAFEKLIHDRLIFAALLDMDSGLSQLQQRAHRIREMATPFSNQIRDNEYKRLADCCPTQDQSIWDYR